MGQFFEELKRRNVFRVAVAYLILSWVIIQVADIVFSAYQMPEWTVTLVVTLLALGFIPALIFSWVYELTPEGLKKDKDVVHDESITRPPSEVRHFDKEAGWGTGDYGVSPWCACTRPFWGVDS